MSRARIGAEVLADVLARAGVDTIFGLPGSTEAALLETLRERAGLRYVLGLHEGAVVSMADGYARVTGRPGVVGLHTSVGTLNGASQIYNSYRDGSPVVVTAGHKDRTVLSEDGFCALPDLPGAVRPFTKWAHQTLSAAELGAGLWRALHAAMTAPAGPAYLAVPEDFLRGPVPADAPDPPVANSALWPGPAGGGTVPNEASCAAGAAELAAARWPVVVVGSEARGCVPELRELADRLVAPLVGTEFIDLADLPFPTADPRYLGLYGEEPAVLDGCDLVLSVGARMFYPFSAVRQPRLPAGARLIHIHPDPAQVGRQLPAAVGLVAAPAPALRALAPHLVRALDPAVTAARGGRLAGLRAERERNRQSERAVSSEPMPVEAVAAELNRVLPPEVVIVDEGCARPPGCCATSTSATGSRCCAARAAPSAGSPGCGRRVPGPPGPAGARRRRRRQLPLLGTGHLDRGAAAGPARGGGAGQRGLPGGQAGDRGLPEGRARPTGAPRNPAARDRPCGRRHRLRGGREADRAPG